MNAFGGVSQGMRTNREARSAESESALPELRRVTFEIRDEPFCLPAHSEDAQLVGIKGKVLCQTVLTARQRHGIEYGSEMGRQVGPRNRPINQLVLGVRQHAGAPDVRETSAGVRWPNPDIGRPLDEPVDARRPIRKVRAIGAL